MRPLPGSPRGHSVVPAANACPAHPHGATGRWYSAMLLSSNGGHRALVHTAEMPSPRCSAHFENRCCVRLCTAACWSSFARAVRKAFPHPALTDHAPWAVRAAAQSTPWIEAACRGGEGPDSKSSLSQGTCGWQHGISALRHARNGVRMCGGRQMPEACGQRGREAVAGAPGVLTNATETLLCSFGKRGRGAAACLSEPMFRRMRT